MNTKFSAILLAALLLLSAASGALAATANATVVAPETVKMTAPMNGTLLPFDLASGDRVASGDVLFAFDTVPVYAQAGGKVAAVFAGAGDDASGVMARYGALAVIEPEKPLFIPANTSQAHEKDENKYLHAGQTLYLKCGNEEGVGMVTSVDGANYIVEILEGDFELGDTIRCFRKPEMKYEEETGRGKATRYADTAVAAQGRIVACHVQPGDQVQVGDLLFEVVDASCAVGATLGMTAPVSGALTVLAVSSGMQVYRGQLLCEIADLDALELSVQVDELDLASLRVGDVLTYTLDAYGEETFSGTVTEIRPIGMARQNATYFDVRLTINTERMVLPGMNGTVTLGK